MIGTADIVDGAVTAPKLAQGGPGLVAIRRLLRAMPDLGDYGIVPSPTTNYTNADFQAAFDGVAADGRRELFIPAGNYRLSEQIQLHRGITLIGEHKSTSVLKAYHTNVAFYADGAVENGGGLRNLSIVNDSGAQILGYVWLRSQADGKSPDFFSIDGCNFTGFSGATAYYGLILDGNLRDGSAPNLLQGLRNIFVRDTDIFNCVSSNVDLRNARGVKLTGVSNYQAGGTVARIVIGGASAAKKSSGVTIIGCLAGDLSISRADKVFAAGSDINNVTITSEASMCRIEVASGSVSNSGASCKVLKIDGSVA